MVSDFETDSFDDDFDDSDDSFPDDDQANRQEDIDLLVDEA